MTNPERNQDLKHCGIDESYIDCFGEHVRIPEETCESLLLVMHDGEPDSIEQGIALRSERALQLPLLSVARVSHQHGFIVTGVERDRLVNAEWFATLESGKQVRGPLVVSDVEGAAGSSDVHVSFLGSADWPQGIHQLKLRAGDWESSSSHLLVAPEMSYQQPQLTGPNPEKLYGLVLQLYALRSRRNWGIGDFTDLRDFAIAAAAQGVDTVGINPIHALFPSNPEAFTPYSPSHRAFINILYIDPEMVDEFTTSEAAAELYASDSFQQLIGACRDSVHVDYQKVSQCKLQMFEVLYADFVNLGACARRASFDRFVAERGEPLALHALYESLYESFFLSEQRLCGWRQWPEEYRDPESPAVAQFARSNQYRIGFFMYLQWLAAQQLETVQRAALEAGMKVGVYLDIAVGVDGGGSETWANQAAYCFGASVGAPPDPMAIEGQDWGFPPFDPYKLRELAYAPMLENLRANMKYAGAIRIDHAVSMLRLWWIPHGGGARHGGYVRYQLEEIVALIALESHRASCLVIGEDLGTVPPELPGVMDRNALYGYRVLYFEMEGERLVPPENYPVKSLATLNTHDLAPLKSWWDCSDIALRQTLGVINDSAVAEKMKGERRHQKQLILNALHHYGWMQTFKTVDEAVALTPEINDGLHAYLCSCSSAVVVSQIEDWMHVVDPFNVPGTFREYPNWQLKYPQEIDGFFEDPERLDRLSLMRRVRTA